MKPSRKTITTLNRFITSTPIWWGKSILIFFAAILLSCEDDPSTIGFKDDTNRFKVVYKELDVPSSVFLADSIATFNDPSLTTDRRLLVGKQFDERFGWIEAEAYTQFRPYNPTYTFPTGALLDSAVLNLTFDYYYYGNQGTAVQQFYVHELTDSLITEQAYYFNTKVAYNPNAIGTVSYAVSPANFDAYLATNRDNDASNNRIDTLSITLSNDFAQRLFAAASSNSADYREFRKFRRNFKGFAIRSTGDQKIVGFNPFNDSNLSALARSRLILYFRIPDVNNAGKFLKRLIDFSLLSVGANNGSMGFSNIKVDRQGTPLANLEDFYKEFFPADNLRYVQGGASVCTRLDFTNFINFADTIDNLVVNSAELVINTEPSFYPMPSLLGLRVLNSNNRFRPGESGIPVYYNNLIAVDNAGFLILGERLNATVLSNEYNLALTRNSDGSGTYSEFYTAFFQRLYSFRDQQLQFYQFGLIPTSPLIGKSVSGVSFKANNIKLRVYYTIPSTIIEN